LGMLLTTSVKPCFKWLSLAFIIAFASLGLCEVKEALRPTSLLLLQPRTAPADSEAQDAFVESLKEVLKAKLKCEVVSFTPTLPGIQLALREGRITHREVSLPHAFNNFRSLLKCLGMKVGMWVRVASVEASKKPAINRITAIELTIVPVVGDASSELIDVEKARAEEAVAIEEGKGTKQRKPKVESIPYGQLFINTILRRLKALLIALSSDYEEPTVLGEDEFAGLIAEAKGLLKSGKLEEAASILRKLAMANPGVPSIYIELGDVYERMKRFTDALLEYERATRVDAKNVEAWYRLAKLNYELGRVEDAWGAVNELLNLSQNNANHFLLAARVARQRASRIAKVAGMRMATEMQNIAKHYYQRALELEYNEDIAVEAAQCVLEMGGANAKKNAVELLRAFLSKADQDKPPLKALSMCLQLLTQMRQLDEAYGVFKQVMKDEPKREWLRQIPYELLGEILDARWAQVYGQVASLLENFWKGLISREDAYEELSWLSSDAERIAAMARELEPPQQLKQAHDRRLLCYDLFSQAIAVAKLYIETGDAIQQRRAYLLMQNAYTEWKALRKM